MVGEVTGGQQGWDRLDLAPDGDALTVILDGPDAGAVRRAEPGEPIVGAAVCIDPGYAPLGGRPSLNPWSVRVRAVLAGSSRTS